MVDREISKLVEEAIDSAAGSVETLASDADLSPHSLWAWVAGRRNPTPENLANLAQVLEARSAKLADLAKQLRAVAED